MSFEKVLRATSLVVAVGPSVRNFKRKLTVSRIYRLHLQIVMCQCMIQNLWYIYRNYHCVFYNVICVNMKQPEIMEAVCELGGYAVNPKTVCCKIVV